VKKSGKAATVIAGLTIGLMLLIATVTAATTQPATPAGTPDIPTAAECTVEALEPMDLLSLVQSGGTGPDLLDATPAAEASLPEGVPASDEEIEGITANVRQLVACANARDPFRLVALLTDDFKLALAGAALGLQGQDPEELAARFPVPVVTEDVAAMEQISMIPLRDARLLADGRVAAILEPSIDGVQQPVDFFVTFELVGDEWLIDEIAVLEPAAGTPTQAP
jgi:hypothetical protein